VGSQSMGYSRRDLVSAAVVAGASLSVASCVSAPRKLALPEPLPPLPPAPVPAQLGPPATLLDQAKLALDSHPGVFVHRDRIALADFALPSSEPRFHIVDLASGRIERSFLVAHGSGSDPARTGMLHQFSNQPGSNATSRGAYLTAGAYVGKHGRSQRLIGLDPDNSMALERAIVVHGAAYVDPRLAASEGRIGRSQGCFALEQDKVGEVMVTLGEGRMIYAGKVA